MGKELLQWRPVRLRERWQHVRRMGFGNFGALVAALMMLATVPGPVVPSDTTAPATHAGATNVTVADAQAPWNREPHDPGLRGMFSATAEDAAAPTAVTPTPSPLVSSPPAMLEDSRESAAATRPHLSSRSAQERALPAPLSAEERFIAEAVVAAQASQRETGVPASVTLAQAILESDWGRSKLAQQGKNYFGIKANGVPGPAGVIYFDTWEHLNGRDVTVRAAFRAYNSMEESFTDHGRYLRDKPIYAEAMKHADDARLFARLIHKAGYATDPSYADKLIRLMDRYNLYQYDR